MKQLHIKLLFLASLLIISSCSTAKKASKSKAPSTEEAKAPEKKADKDAIKPYNKVITKDAKSNKGLFTVHQIDEDYFYEIPDSLFEREMLMVTRIAKTANGIGFGNSCYHKHFTFKK